MQRNRVRALASIPIVSPSSVATANRTTSSSCRRPTSPRCCSTAWKGSSVDAKALLRRYLEQRRELGESELVLDSLQVDEVMRLLGAAGRPQPTATLPGAQPSLRQLAEEISGQDLKDWRDSLPQAG